jgi:hypothetical protein
MSDMRPSTRKIIVGNGTQVDTIGQGTVTIIDKNAKKVRFTDVYYAPDFTKNIVSFRKLLDNEWTISVADKSAFIFNDAKSQQQVKFGRSSQDTLFYIKGIRTAEDHKDDHIHAAIVNNSVLDINIAHGLLGHPNIRTVKLMASILGWTLTGHPKPCGSCALAKGRAKAIPKTTLTRAKHPGERLFLDISGPYSDSSLNSNKYWLRIVDDKTRYSWDCFFGT